MKLLETCESDDVEFAIMRGRRPGTWFAVFKNPQDAFVFDMAFPWVFWGCPITNSECAFDITEMKRRPN